MPDVTILHDIVVHAQELLPSLPEQERVPTNALFHAYYAILPSIGIDVDHDSRYARVLFKIGGMRGDGTLYEKFESVLSRMGIEIQFEQEDSNEGGEDKSESQAYQDPSPQTNLNPTPADANQGTKHYRRNSEGSLWDPTSGHDDVHRARRRSFSSLSKRTSPEVVDPRYEIHGLLQRPAHAVDPPLFRIESISSRREQEKHHGVGAWLNDSLTRNLARRQTGSDSTHGSIQVYRRSLLADVHDPTASPVAFSTGSSLPFSALSQSTEADPRGIVSDPSDNVETLARALKTPKNIKIKLVRESHHKNLVRQVWSQWQSKTSQLLEDSRNLEILAEHRDRQILLRQAFDSWRTHIVERWQIGETERFFEHLERRAGRARDLFLLTKAFTHWAYSASDGVQRTSLARRHILRSRYFKAWREITAINELKVRRQILRRFFSTWKRRLVGTSICAANAADSFAHNLIQKIFWSWFWAFCQRRAPLWWADNLRRRQLASWVQRIRRCRELEHLAQESYRHKVSLEIYLVWKRKMIHYAVQRRQASEFRTTISLEMAIAEWHFGLRVLPLLNNLRANRKLSIQRAFFNVWVVRARQEIQAAAIDRLKIMREACLSWNDKLRCHALQVRMNDRLVLQGLYRWVLAERSVLAQRLLERKIMRFSLAKMDGALQATVDTDARDNFAARRFCERKSLMNAIRCWQDALGAHKLHVYLVSKVVNPKILNDCLTRWLNRRQQIQQQHNWAHDGHFYFAVSKRLKSWKNAMETLKREKRRTAYSQFRRKTKVKLATEVLLAWRQQTHAVIEAKRMASDLYYNRRVVTCLEIFDQWRGRAEEVAELASIGEQFLLGKRFNEIKSTLMNHRRLIMAAIRSFEDHATALCMKKWSRVALQLRARQHLVFELREKYMKKTLRKIIFHWKQRAAKQQFLHDSGLRTLNNAPSPKNRVWSSTEMTKDLSELDDHEIEDWADRGDETVTSTPLPGYLTTPSKRMPRAAAVAALSSTTPGVPLSTPAERLLRAQYSGGSLPYFRRTLGKSSIS